tara:strand:+ start:1695 stop:1877 length:183 start_codon:yes stop_codon:yes gene_type:complete
MEFPDLKVPGFLLNADQIDALIETATEVLDETGPDARLTKFIEDASRLRAVHDSTARPRG